MAGWGLICPNTAHTFILMSAVSEPLAAYAVSHTPGQKRSLFFKAAFYKVAWHLILPLQSPEWWLNSWREIRRQVGISDGILKFSILLGVGRTNRVDWTFHNPPYTMESRNNLLWSWRKYHFQPSPEEMIRSFVRCALDNSLQLALVYISLLVDHLLCVLNGSWPVCLNSSLQ